jgi:hypothetical protein
MKDTKRKNIGMQLLVRQYRDKFEIDENINYYTYKDFLRAQRKYLKYMLDGAANRHAGQSY